MQPNQPIQETERAKIKSIVWEFVKFAILAALIVIPVRTFIAQPFIVSGSSMDPTFASGQYLIVDELSYRILGKPQRGDVIILRYPNDPSKFFIKRVIGMPNDTLEIAQGTVTIKNNAHPDGFPIAEPYVAFPKQDSMTKTLGAGEYFVMGDNRAASSDSRAWGTVPEKLIVGKAFLRLFPIASADVLPGSYKYDSQNQ